MTLEELNAGRIARRGGGTITTSCVELDLARELVTKIMVYRNKLKQFENAEKVEDYPVKLDKANDVEVWVSIDVKHIIASLEQSITSMVEQLKTQYGMELED
jgi:hypothetical protein